MGQVRAHLCTQDAFPNGWGVGHDIGNMSLIRIDYSTRIGSLNKHSTKGASCQLYETQYLSKYN